MSQLHALARVASIPAGFTSVCAVLASATGTDPMLAVELAALASTGAWLVLLGRGARRALAETERLQAESRPLDVAGTDIRLVNASGPAAFVAGLLRPRIYLSRSLIESLDSAELRGVILHEEHHRRTRAPLRAMMLESWHRLFGWLPAARRALEGRLAAMEIEADASAVAQGTSPATLASALLKCDVPMPAVSSAFSAAAGIRIDELVSWDRQERVERRLSIPVEWAGPASAAIALWVCHLFGA